MKLRIEDITAEVKELRFAETEDEINRLLDKGPVREYRLSGPLMVDVSHYRSGMDLFFEGHLTGAVTATCARCAEEFTKPSSRAFRFVLAPKSVGDDANADLRSEDLEFSLYSGEDVDLSPLIREQMLLALPTRPLCDEGCRGLCPMCGINLNSASCKCVTTVPDPRLAALRNFKVVRSAR